MEEQYAHEIQTDFKREEEIKKEYISKSGRRRVSRNIKKKRRNKSQHKIKNILEQIKNLLNHD